MADDIEIHFHAAQGVLSLACGKEAFERIRDIVIASGGVGDAGIEGVPTHVRNISVTLACSRIEHVSRWADRIGLLGCGLVVFGCLFVFGVGVRTIAAWWH